MTADADPSGEFIQRNPRYILQPIRQTTGLPCCAPHAMRSLRCITRCRRSLPVVSAARISERL